MIRPIRLLLPVVVLLLAVLPGSGPSNAASGDRYFPETGFTVPAIFAGYWDKHGGLPIFGYPITAAQMENGYLTQYFERNRFEYHPEYAGTPSEVLLGLLGVDITRHRGFIH